MWFFRSVMLNRNTKNYVYILMFHDYLSVYSLRFLKHDNQIERRRPVISYIKGMRESSVFIHVHVCYVNILI